MKDLGRNIAKLRKQHGLSQRDLANLSGISNRVIAYYEKEADSDFLNKLEKIANALNVAIFDLFPDENAHKKNEQSIDFSKLDTRTLKKIKELLELSPQERSAIYKNIDGYIATKQLAGKK